MPDVVIVGAGPVGLFLACELGLVGCSVVVLEREPESDPPWKALPLGLRGLSAGSVEAFHRRGLLEPLLAASGVRDAPGVAPDADEAPPPRGVGHFGGMMLDPARVEVAALPYRLPSPAMDGVMTSLENPAGTVMITGTRLPYPTIQTHEIVELLIYPCASCLGLRPRIDRAITSRWISLVPS